MDLSELELGEIVYGHKPVYSGRFFSDIKVYPCKVEKISDKSIWLSWNKRTEKYPERYPRKNADALWRTKYTVCRELLINLGKFPDYKRVKLAKKLVRMLQIEERRIKKESESNGKN